MPKGKPPFQDSNLKLSNNPIAHGKILLHNRRLCAEIAEVASCLLSGGCEDERLWELGVSSVEQHPGHSRLIIRVFPKRPMTFLEFEALMKVLNRARPFFRREIAQAIYRKRTPEIVFELTPTPETKHEE